LLKKQQNHIPRGLFVMQSNTLYIASLEPEAGKLVVTMGFMEFLTRSTGNVAFFRPVIDTEKAVDPDIDLIRSRYCPAMTYDECYGFEAAEVKTFVAEGRFKFFLEELLKKLNDLKDKYDFVLCQGLNSTSFLSAFDMDINMEIAKNLGCPFIGVINGMDQTPRDIAKEIKITEDAITESGCAHSATFVNRMAEDTLGVLEVELDDPEDSGVPVFLLPENEELDKILDGADKIKGLTTPWGAGFIITRTYVLLGDDLTEEQTVKVKKAMRGKHGRT